MKTRKLLLGTALSLLTVALLGSSINSISATNGENVKTYTEQDRDIETGYLLRENFSIYQQATSGWETKNMPHGVNIGLADVRSSNNQIPVYIKKNFVRQTGEIVIDMVVTLSSDITRGYLSVLGYKNNKETKGILLVVENNVVKYVNGEGNKITIATLSYDYDLGIRIIANASENKASIEINGEDIDIAKNLTFNQEVDSLCGVKFGFDQNDIGGFKFKSLEVRKGYEYYEDFSTVGYVSRVSPDFDYNQLTGVYVNATVNDHTTQNDNNSLGYLAFDNDDSTYWEHNPNYAITKNVYFMVNYPQMVSVDTIRLKFASYYKGYIETSICTPSGSWKAISDTYRYFAFETTEANNYTLDIQVDDPQNLTILAIGFTVGGNGFDIPGGEIKIATMEAYCKNPKPVEINTYPSAWTKQESKNTTAGITSYSNDKAFALVNNNGQNNCSAGVDFDIKGNASFEFTTMISNDKNGNRIDFVNQNNDYIGLETKDAKLNFIYNNNGQTIYTPIVNQEQSLNALNPGLWSRFIINHNNDKNTVNIDYNGWNPIGDIQLPESYKNSEWKHMNVISSRSKTEIAIDSIKIYQTLPESNVPDVEPCDTGDTIVTMQVCSLWREGTHTGWGILDNPELCGRQTLLGYYDEGTSNVADWEIKIAREHGISNFMFCWYRNNNGPIKTSKYSDALWDGLFKSKFRNDINFSVMLENAGANVINSYEDLTDNIMPYFIETFFKNPNYQRTKDGKPVLYVYIPDIANSIGDANKDGSINNEDVVFATNRMREICVEAGLPGLYISAETRLPSSTSVTKIESLGYDSIFSYTWSSGYFNVNDDYTLSYSKNAIETQFNALNNMKMIPSLSKQWDPSAWMNCGFNPEGATYSYDLEHYRQFALWIKDLADNHPIDDVGTKMIMLDNWNEYSEGHWLMPSYDAPAYKNGRMAYGYLDILREVFGIYEYAHTDYFPREDGFGVYDTWYPQAWDEPLSKYLDMNGEPKDDSVKESEIIDWEIGYDTCGGKTTYIDNTASSSIDALEANRVVVSQETVKSIKASSQELTINTLYGVITVSKEELTKLDENKPLEIVLNKNIDCTQSAIALRKNSISFEEIATYTYSMKQKGEIINVSALVIINESMNFDKIYLMDGSLKEMTSSLSLNGQATIVLVQE